MLVSLVEKKIVARALSCVITYRLVAVTIEQREATCPFPGQKTTLLLLKKWPCNGKDRN